MKLETNTVLESHGTGSRVILKVTVDGIECGSVLICSGPRPDVEAFYRGEITLVELQERFGMKG